MIWLEENKSCEIRHLLSINKAENIAIVLKDTFKLIGLDLIKVINI